MFGAWRAWTSWVGRAQVSEGVFSTLNSQQYLAYARFGSGWINTCGTVSTNDFASQDPKAAFFILFGSHFSDWNFSDNILRAPLATTTGLVSVYSGYPHWLLHRMALGGTAGDSARLTQNNGFLNAPDDIAFWSGTVFYQPQTSKAGGNHITLLGDPTRLHAVMPVTNVTAVNGTGSIAINWSASTDTVVGYHVYRSASTNGPFARLTANVVTGTSFTDTTVTTGTHSYMVRAVKLETSASGSYYNLSQGFSVTTTYTAPVAAIQDRHVFYNGSKFDNNNSAATSDDDSAIATDKEALLPGGVAAFKNYTSYSKGLNGVMVDISNLPGTPTASDFTFKVGDSNTPSAWATAPAPTSITVRAGAGTGGSDRITLIWADRAIQKQWLEVTVKPGANTGLSAADVFYFGNIIGETGNSTANTNVDGQDLSLIRANQSGFGTVGITSAYDFNRDGVVDGQDLSLLRGNQSGFTPVALIQPPAALSMTAAQQASTPAIALPELRSEDTSKPGVAGRWIFYNNSQFDKNNPASNSADDAAIATDKEALLPGWAASFKNYTSYSKGINGVMVDIRLLPGTPTASDFAFSVGNDNTPGIWSSAATPSSVTVRKGAGMGGSDRVTLTWKDNSIQKQWLEVTVKATSNTGLSSPEVFYFGNAIGETGNSKGNAIVDAADASGAQSHPSRLAEVNSAYDFDRSGAVNAADVALARKNRTTSQNALNLINPLP